MTNERAQQLADMVADQDEPRVAGPRNFTNWTESVTKRTSYDGADLRPYEGRPGALDFKKIPSLGLK